MTAYTLLVQRKYRGYEAACQYRIPDRKGRFQVIGLPRYHYPFVTPRTKINSVSFEKCSNIVPTELRNCKPSSTGSKHRFQIQLRSDNTVDPRSESEPLDLDNDQGERIAKLINLGNFEEIAKLPGQPSPSCSGRSDTPHHTTVAINPNVAR